MYFDNEDMDSYVSRLQREDRAAATRIRFYGHRSRSSSQEVFLERKVHREPWTGEQSCKVGPFIEYSKTDSNPLFLSKAATLTILLLGGS